jgi:hypothetical protein
MIILDIYTLKVFQWYKKWTKFTPCTILSSVWEVAPWSKLNPFSLKKFPPKGNCFLGKLTHGNLVIFSPREHGWEHHFVSSLGKVPISLRHFTWKNSLRLFFHPFCSWKKKISWGKNHTMNTLVEGGDSSH